MIPACDGRTDGRNLSWLIQRSTQQAMLTRCKNAIETTHIDIGRTGHAKSTSQLTDVRYAQGHSDRDIRQCTTVQQPSGNFVVFPVGFWATSEMSALVRACQSCVFLFTVVRSTRAHLLCWVTCLCTRLDRRSQLSTSSLT